ncbi:unnamed protein product [Gadus morhua 'NCC']
MHPSSIFLHLCNLIVSVNQSKCLRGLPPPVSSSTFFLSSHLIPPPTVFVECVASMCSCTDKRAGGGEGGVLMVFVRPFEMCCMCFMLAKRHLVDFFFHFLYASLHLETQTTS